MLHHETHAGPLDKATVRARLTRAQRRYETAMAARRANLPAPYTAATFSAQVIDDLDEAAALLDEAEDRARRIGLPTLQPVQAARY